MKIGTFVGKEFLTLSVEDIETIKKEFVSKAKEMIGDFDGGFSVQTKVRELNGGTHLYITLTFKGDKVYRHINGSKFRPLFVSADLYFQRGYDQAKEGLFYEWAEGYKPNYDIESYSLRINLMGDYRRYRGKTMEHCVGIVPTSYTYGTELADLKVADGVTKISNYLKRSTISKF